MVLPSTAGYSSLGAAITRGTAHKKLATRDIRIISAQHVVGDTIALFGDRGKIELFADMMRIGSAALVGDPQGVDFDFSRRTYAGRGAAGDRTILQPYSHNVNSIISQKYGVSESDAQSLIVNLHNRKMHKNMIRYGGGDAMVFINSKQNK